MYPESDLLPLSGLQHLLFCPRQWGLIHLEGMWAENRLTAEGRVVHERADHAPDESRGDVRVVRGLMIRSLRLGLSGRADVVEFRKKRTVPSPLVSRSACDSPDFSVVPVEYKRGKPKRDHVDLVQLCAQALCLEEMLSVSIAGGAMYYHQTRRRLEVEFDAGLRAETEGLALRMHEIHAAGVTPAPVYGKWCESCSLMEKCMPKTLEKPKSVARYLHSLQKSANEG